MKLRTLKNLSLAMVLGFGAANLALAQQTPAAPPPSETFSDMELETFVAVQPDLQNTRQEYIAMLETTDDQEEAQTLQQEANQEMATIIQEAGLEIERYNQIAMAVQQDQELLTRIEQLAE